MPSHERIVAVGGLQNYRDLGGYVTRDGKHVVMYKHVYRADNVGAATPEGRRILMEKLHVHYIIDFRSDAEKSCAPSADSGFLYYAIPIDACAMRQEVMKRDALDGPDAEQLIRDVAKTFLVKYKDAFKRFFNVLLEEVKGQPAVFHCTAGKDRTGVAAALLLYALNVPIQTIMEDFLLTNHCCVPPTCASMKIGDCAITQEALNVLFRAQPYFLEIAFGAVHTTYGSVTAYMEKELGLDKKRLERLRDYYTRPKSS